MDLAGLIWEWPEYLALFQGAGLNDDGTVRRKRGAGIWGRCAAKIIMFDDDVDEIISGWRREVCVWIWEWGKRRGWGRGGVN